MTGKPRSRALVALVFLGVVAALGAVVLRAGYQQALDTLSERGEADLALASDRVTGQLQRYRELAVLLADHPIVEPLTEGAQPQAASALFQDVADKTAALEILFINPSGAVRAAARGPVRGNLAGQPFVRRAMQGALGSGIADDAPLAQRSFYFAAPHFGPSGLVRGAVVVAADIGEIEWDWTGSNPAVFFTDPTGRVRITNRSELRQWRRSEDGEALVPPTEDAPKIAVRRIGVHKVWRLDWGPYLPASALFIERDLPVIGLTAVGLIDTRSAWRLAVFQAAAFAGLCLAFGALLFLAWERRRTLAEANTKLEARVAKRTRALSESNAALRREVGEREEAEAALRKAQRDLVQAGKLSALGQMSAGISHELNQPLMAIQSFAENASAFLERGKADRAGDNLGRISELAHRMGRIIRNLRAFARQESAPVSRVDVVGVLDSALELTESRLNRVGVTMHYDRPAHPVWVQGGEVRLAQVFVNLITNAVDAMAGQAERALWITVEEGARLAVTVRDNGPGIDMPDKVFEPFYSTKATDSQDGMGLGLSISYGIVQSFGGDIRGANADGGGAVFTVELERWADEVAA